MVVTEWKASMEMGMETPAPALGVIYNGQFLGEEEAVLFKNVIPW